MTQTTANPEPPERTITTLDRVVSHSPRLGCVNTPTIRRSSPGWACRHVLLNFDTFHKPCLTPWRTSFVELKAAEQGWVKIVIIVPRVGHVPVLQAAQLFLRASHWRFPPRRLDGTTAGRYFALLALLLRRLFIENFMRCHHSITNKFAVDDHGILVLSGGFGKELG